MRTIIACEDDLPEEVVAEFAVDAFDAVPSAVPLLPRVV
jgi:hypothetical protein